MLSPQHYPGRNGVPAYREREPKLRPRLLVVEDALCIQKILRAILRKIDVDVDIAENGEIACKKAEKSKEEGRPYEVILMDMQMPHVSGYEAHAASARKKLANPHYRGNGFRHAPRPSEMHPSRLHRLRLETDH